MSEVTLPVDLRSDTVTRPVLGMRLAMAHAEVGDDVYREDPSVNRLEQRVVELLGKESALFVPSGTMSNQLCVRTHTRPGDEVIVHEGSHVLNYEGGAAAALSRVQLHPVGGENGQFGPETVQAAVQPPGEHFPRTPLVVLENTHNRAGGTVWPLEAMTAVSRAAWELGLAVHLDGARLWNAHIAAGTPLSAYAAQADSVSVCFSKGLGGPVGSALAGPRDFVEEARYHRERHGGAMRQAGILAAAAYYALDHHVGRLREDHENAGILARRLEQVEGVLIPHPVESNIVLLDIGALNLLAPPVLEELARRGVLAGAAAPTCIRLVTHLDASREQVEWAAEVVAAVLEGGRPDLNTGGVTGGRQGVVGVPAFEPDP